MSSVILYDIDRKDGRACWSPNVWKTRYVLSFKNIEYKTRWLEFPDIKPTLEAQGFAKPAEGSYTCPAIILDSTSSNPIPIMDSDAIAKALEERHPEPSLFLDSPVLSDVHGLLAKLRRILGPVILPLLLNNVLNHKSAEWKEKALVGQFGMPVNQIEKEMGGEPMWERLREPLQELAFLLKRQEGPFILGHTVSYADFVVASFLQSGQRLGDGMLYDRIVAFDQSFERLLEATKKWAERDDH